MRNYVDIYHNKWYNAALSFSEKVEVVEAKARVCRLQINRSNVPSERVSDYFKKTTLRGLNFAWIKFRGFHGF